MQIKVVLHIYAEFKKIFCSWLKQIRLIFMADDSTSQACSGMKCKNCMMPICSEECGDIHQNDR